MRTLQRPEIAQFLKDEEPSLVREAACAIHDEDIGDTMAQLAALIEKPTADEALMCRVLNANFRVGLPANATALALYAGRKDMPEALRVDALNLLASWQRPPALDYVTGLPQTLPERDSAPISEAVGAILPALMQEQDARSPAFKQALVKIVLAGSRSMPKGLK
jgi:quinoprotein glucose dehydrogenase